MSNSVSVNSVEQSQQIQSSLPKLKTHHEIKLEYDTYETIKQKLDTLF